MSKIRDLVVYLNLKYCLDWECQIGDWFLSAVKMGEFGFKLDFKGLDFEWKMSVDWLWSLRLRESSVSVV